MLRRHPILATASVAVLSVGLVTGCSSSKSGNSGSGGSTSGGAGASSTSAALVEAQRNVDTLLKVPTNVGITTPLSKKPPTGKRIVVSESPEPTSLKVDAGFKAAAAALGWQVTVVQEGTGAEGPGNALGQAISLKPDAIAISGNPLSTMRSQVQRAKAAGITVIQSDTGEPVQKDGSIYTLSLDGFDQTGAGGKNTADYIATQGSKHTLVIDLSLYPILHAYSQGVVDELKKVSPGTKTTLIDTTLKDFIAGGVPKTVVSAIQRNSDIDWVVLTLADMTVGLKSALSDAGFASKVKIAGQSAGPANITELKNKQAAVFTGFAATIEGWRRADALARIFNGDSLDPNNNSLLPTQLLTPDNVATAPFDKDGYYLAVPSYEADYKKLWKLTG